MKSIELPELVEIAARAAIHERCALSYLHEVRGSMQALFSAVELMGRSAVASGDNHERIDKARDLARRAIGNHERSTLATLQALTLLPTDPTVLDLNSLLDEVVRLLRNDAAAQDIKISLIVENDLKIVAEVGKLHTMFVGLLVVSIDATPRGEPLELTAERLKDEVIVTLGSAAGLTARESKSLQELTYLFAQRYLLANGGRLDVDPDAAPRGRVRVVYPALPSCRSFADARASSTAK